MEKIFKYKAFGVVLGNFWGGGFGAFPTINFKSENKTELIEQINKSLIDGSMDCGMGFKSLIGAILKIKTETIIYIDDDAFINEKESTIIVGTMTDEEQYSLCESYNHWEICKTC